jgi:hypothetical protein
MSRNAVIGIVAVVAFIALLAWLSLGQKQHRVEVCVEFEGRQNCRIASGPTRDQALRTAADNACATIASGMTDSMACSHSKPVSVRWLD